MLPERTYWFPAKRYGWGWGWPSSWQGWVVLVAFSGLLIAGWFALPPDTPPRLYLAYVVLVTALLIVVCWVKGEPPRWRWGE